MTYAPNVEGVLKDIELVGTSVGLADPAKDLTASMSAGFRPGRRRHGGPAATTGLLRARRHDRHLHRGRRLFIAEMITLAGGDAITTGSATDFAISVEALISADPEVIVLGDAAYGVTADAVPRRGPAGTS